MEASTAPAKRAALGQLRDRCHQHRGDGDLERGGSMGAQPETTGFKVSTKSRSCAPLSSHRQMRREPILHHLADACRRLVRKRGGVGEDLEVVLLPAELGQLLHQHLVVGLDGALVRLRRLAAVGDRLEDGGDLRLDRRALSGDSSSSSTAGEVSPCEMKP